MSKSKIQPRLLKGFRDYLPQAALAREQMIRTLQDVFASFAFTPIDTPALEYAEILLGKGSEETDRQLFRFEDNGGRDVALRFDLTVPLARFAAMYTNDLGSPFKRYHIAPVWRAEKPQRGRFREFIQCDFDILGAASAQSDAEIVAVIHSALEELGVAHKIRINNRKLLNGLLETLGVSGSSAAVLRAIDKLDKQGEEAVRRELSDTAGLDSDQASRLMEFLQISESSPSAAIEAASQIVGRSEIGMLGASEMKAVIDNTEAYGIPAECLEIDLRIARGLDYYTGTVFETLCSELPDIGSICSGGRYDNLVEVYSNRQLPGVGASIGLDRLMAALEELEKLSARSTPADVLITIGSEAAVAPSCALASKLRQSGLNAYLYPEVKKLANQLKFANRIEVPFAIIASDEQLSVGKCSLKDMQSGEQLDDLTFDIAAEKLLARR
ncbi:MAG: histidine--tRNA ligase [Bdellovibrionales bacterium]|nr:histidine--tRNA ligase [Bdellovibrionales bacterium]